MKIRIPTSLVTVLDESIFDTYSEINDSTAELTPEPPKHKTKEFYISESSKIKFSIINRVTSTGSQECIVILLNSKFCKDRYFEGIHFDIIENIYNEIIKLKVIDIDFETFLRSDVTDIDLKLDERMSQLSWSKNIDLFKKNTKASPLANKGYKPFPPTSQRPLQNGLQFSNRKGATDARPFIKLYWKGGELLSESIEFYKEHIENKIDFEELKKVVRVEVTIKNKNHAKRCGIEDCTLLGILSLRQDSLLKAFQYMMQKYINPVSFNNTPKIGLSSTEIVLYDSLKLALNYMSPEEAIDRLTVSQLTPSAKSKKKRILKDIYTDYIKLFEPKPADKEALIYLQQFDLIA